MLYKCRTEHGYFHVKIACKEQKAVLTYFAGLMYYLKILKYRKQNSIFWILPLIHAKQWLVETTYVEQLTIY
jgi:hypothetical protein